MWCIIRCLYCVESARVPSFDGREGLYILRYKEKEDPIPVRYGLVLGAGAVRRVAKLEARRLQHVPKLCKTW